MKTVDEIANIANKFLKKKYKDFDDFMYNTNLIFDEDKDIYFIRGYVTRKRYNPMLKYKIEIKNNSVIKCSSEGEWDNYFKISKMFDLNDEGLTKKLEYFDFVLTEFDNLSENIFNYINKWKEIYRTKDKFLFKLILDIEFKINESYSLFIEIANAIFDLTFIYYRTYHGPFKEKMIKNKLFTESIKGSEAITKITYLLDSFFVQYISLLDYITKLVCQIGDNPNFEKIESYPKLFHLKNRKFSQNEQKILENLFLYFDEMNEIRYYRNAMVHQKIIPKNHYTKRINSYLLSEIVIASIKKIKDSNKNHPEYEFDIGKSGSPRSGYTIVLYCTYAYFKLLSTIKNTFSIMDL
jgi:hypothetical protein